MTTKQKKSNIDDVTTIKHLKEALRSEGIRITQQRTAILAALVGSDDHPTVEMLYQRANKLMNHVSLATVYRTVTVLVECGAVVKNEFDGSWMVQSHFHVKLSFTRCYFWLI